MDFGLLRLKLFGRTSVSKEKTSNILFKFHINPWDNYIKYL